jgi:CSLREA domain-containing protein
LARSHLRSLPCALAAAFLLLWAVPALASAAVIEVNTTADGLPAEGEPSCTGEPGVSCTLREAIEQANNAEGPDSITFGALPAGEHQLSVEETSLPTIFEQVAIEGDTAPGATPGVPALELVPTGMSEEEFTTGFQVQAGTGTRIEGFAIGGFSAGIELAATEGGRAEETQICGNYIGTDLSGEVAAPNHVGVEMFSFVEGEQPIATEVGGTGCLGNVISGNSEYGVRDNGIATTVAGNSIGIGAQPSGEILPDGTGILEEEMASGAMIGGTDPSGSALNVISYNEGPGVRIEAGEGSVAVRHDSFSENGGQAIERAVKEPPAPTILRAQALSAAEFEIEGSVTGVGDGEETVEVDIYGSPACDASGAGEGQTFLGTASVPVDAGPEPFTSRLPVQVPGDDTAITATMSTAAAATSEFSECANFEPPPPGTFVVTTLGDGSGGGCGQVCSLREAIEAADDFSNPDTIDFDVAGLIEPLSELPEITEPVEIDGTSAPGYAGSPVIEIGGSEALNHGGTEGLVIGNTAEDTTIRGLTITRFDDGINVVGNHALIEADTVTGNGDVGVAIFSTAPQTAIRGSEIYGNGTGTLTFQTPNSVPSPEVEAFAAGPTDTNYFVPVTGGEPDTTYAIDVFADAHCEKPGEHGPLEVFLAGGEATTDSGGEVRAEIHGGGLAGINAEVFTVTTTDLETGTTSRVSHCAYAPIETALESTPPALSSSPSARFTFAGLTVGNVEGFECDLDGAGFSACASPQEYTGLGDGEHTFEVRAISGEGFGAAPESYTWTVAATPPTQQQQQQVQQSPQPPGPQPSNGEKVVVAPEEGKVLIKLPGSKKFVTLKELKEIPVGAIIDATKGRVTLTSIDPDGTEQTAEFFGGVFKVKQREGAGLVVLELLDTVACPATGSSLGGTFADVRATASAAGSARASGKLWGSGHGNFRTEGNDGSATVRGTIWLVEDRCDGTTFFRTRRGVVSVRDFVAHKTLPLPAGKTYLAGSG